MAENEEKKLSPGETFKRALALHLSGRLEEARIQYCRILDIQPRHTESLLNLGLIHHHFGNMNEAAQLISAAIRENPESALAHYSLGNLQQDLNQYDAALASYRRAFSIKPDYAEAYNNHGNVLLKLERLDEALASYDRAIEINPRLSEVFNNHGVALRKKGLYREALASFDKAVALKPDYAEAWYNQGCARKDLKDLAGALQCYDRVLALRPNYIDALNTHGVTLKELGRYAEALASYDKVIALKPDHFEAWNNRGLALKNLNHYQEALQSIDKAIALKPDFAEAWNNRGLTLKDLYRYQESLQSLDKAIALKTDFAEAWNNRGVAYQEIRQHDKALENFRKAIALKPDYAEAHLNEGFCCLQMGIFDIGWQKYEWRWKSDYSGLTPPKFPYPQWDGTQDINGRTILLHAEQGLGDVIQFCRYVKNMNERGARVLIGIQPQLKSLLATLPWPVQIVVPGETLPPLDYHCPFLSLPLAFGTTLDTIPADIPYLYADVERVRNWRGKLPEKKSLRVGLVWSGTTRHKNDRNRSFSLTALKPLMELPVEYYSLQKELRECDQETLAASGITHFGAELVDFSDTAALIELMDLIITVDTSVAHLAGAMGKPLWLLLSYISDFRWLLDRDDSPWYPTARLFRQLAIGDWETVLAQVRTELENKYTT